MLATCCPAVMDEPDCLFAFQSHYAVLTASLAAIFPTTSAADRAPPIALRSSFVCLSCQSFPSKFCRFTDL